MGTTGRDGEAEETIQVCGQKELSLGCFSGVAWGKKKMAKKALAPAVDGKRENRDVRCLGPFQLAEGTLHAAPRRFSTGD